MKKVKTAAVIGLGAIGGYVAPKLEECLGHENFKIIAGGKRKERLEQGVVINDVKYHFQIADSGQPQEPVDFIIFAVKNTGLEQAIADVKPFVGEETILMSLLNGVESEEKIQGAYPNNHMLYSVIRIPALHQDGKISYPKDKGKISFGEKEKGKISLQVEMIEELFKASHICYEIPEDMLQNMWSKFMTNVSENQSSAILGTPYGIWTISEDANLLRESAAKEVIAIAQKKGINLTEEMLIEHRSYYKHHPFYGKTSTLQDIEAKRKTEVETFAGTVRRMGKEYGIPTPYNDMFYHAIRALETWNEYQDE